MIQDETVILFMDKNEIRELKFVLCCVVSMQNKIPYYWANTWCTERVLWHGKEWSTEQVDKNPRAIRRWATLLVFSLMSEFLSSMLYITSCFFTGFVFGFGFGFGGPFYNKTKRIPPKLFNYSTQENFKDNPCMDMDMYMVDH